MKPRLVVFRSNKHLYVQLVDDEKNKVLAAVSDLKLKSKKRGVELARDLAILMAVKAKEKEVQKIVLSQLTFLFESLPNDIHIHIVVPDFHARVAGEFVTRFSGVFVKI